MSEFILLMLIWIREQDIQKQCTDPVWPHGGSVVYG